MDKSKYLKYKAKYFALKNKMKQLHGGALEFTTLDNENQINYLFRCAPNVEQLITPEGRLANVRVCSDTGKRGLYFANKPIMSLAMCIELDKLMDLIVFRITENIEDISVGKYAFREINPDRYITPDGEFINAQLLPEENVSHIECSVSPLDNKFEPLLPSHIEDGLLCLNSCEVFLSTLNEDHLNNLECEDIFRFNPDKIKTPADLLKYMKASHFPFGLGKYIEDGILIKIR